MSYETDKRKVQSNREILAHKLPAGQLAIIENSLGYHIDRSRFPFNAFRELFKFRNSIVHAKPAFLPIVMTPETGYPVPISKGKTPLTEWEKQASLENSHRLVSRSESMMDILAKQAGISLPSDDHAVTKVWLDIPNQNG